MNRLMHGALNYILIKMLIRNFSVDRILAVDVPIAKHCVT
jgi:hypothetical protein